MTDKIFAAFQPIRKPIASTVIVLLLLIIGNAQVLAKDSDQPNIVVIFTDDQVHNAIGYDNPEVVTPHLDGLARSGLIF